MATAGGTGMDAEVPAPDPGPPGTVAWTDSSAGFDAAAGARAVKGVVWERGAHRMAQAMERWVCRQEPAEPAKMHFARERLIVAPPPTGCGDPNHPCGQYAREQPARAEDVTAACARVTAALPESFRDAVRADCEAIVRLLRGLCPAAPFLTMQIDIIGKNACRRWHQDNYVGRVTITYTGPGTWMVDDASVDFSQFIPTMEMMNDKSDPLIVPRPEAIHRAPSNAVALIKGRSWPGNSGSGLIHKAPNMPADLGGDPMPLRLMLKIDLSLTP